MLKYCVNTTKALKRLRADQDDVLCVGHLGQQIVEHVSDGARFGLDVTYSFDGEQLLGTGGALRAAAPQLGPLFWVIYGDSYLDFDYQAALEHFLRRSEPALMTVFRNQDRWDRSNVLFDQGRVIRYDKRQPSPRCAGTNLNAYDRIAANLKEIVNNSNRLTSKHLFPYLHQLVLYLEDRSHVGFFLRVPGYGWRW